MNIKFNWEVKLDDDTTKSIEEKIVAEISPHKSYENFEFVATINKNPKDGVDILVVNQDESIRFEGRYQGHPSSAATILWADNPLPGTR